MRPDGPWRACGVETAVRTLLRLMRGAFEPFERLFAGESPFHHLGALTIYLFWIVLVSGLYVFAFYETSVAGAYASVERLTHEQWYLGGVMRSLHRYASDAAVLTLEGSCAASTATPPTRRC